MKVLYDENKDILQISFNLATIEETAQIAPGLILDYDEDGNVIGVELRQASKKVDDPYNMAYVVDNANLNKPPLKGDSYS
ncbi:MAG: putative conserved small protein [Phormidesmis priestleyi Ana]|uniref:Putative conserved small protein n=1 Tax=Phormidesmis priestleyi Ana TaxID=1666911 RepID=A0A0P7ZY67_9CYAN|nr:MAG: putative conserved small protein [Phormidesmis priestleyi Ana]